MKKYLLGALLVLGTMTYAQENMVIKAVDAEGNATANLGIEVSGKVFTQTDLSLVVDIKSAAAATGTGFAFEMPNMFAGKSDSKTAQGNFETYLEQDGAKVPFSGDLAVNLINNGAVVTAGTVSNEEPTGTATGVKIDYTLIGGTGDIDMTGKTSHEGGVQVKTTTTEATTAGTYSDTSVQLRIALTGQDMTPVL